MEIILRADPAIFKNLSVNRLLSVINRNDFYLAKMYLMLGVDASQVYHGRNALDAALVASNHCQRFLRGFELVPKEFQGSSAAYQTYCVEVETERQDFINQLRKYNLSVSLTIENYDEAVMAKLYDFAAEILKKADFGARVEYSKGDDRISPLSVALSRKHAPTINAVMKEYLEKLTIPQLMEAKQTIFWFYDPKPEEVLHRLALIKSQITEIENSRSKKKYYKLFK